MEERIDRNEVKIANRDIRIYLGECDLLFQRFDQIILSAGDSYVEKMRYIANILSALGVKIEEEYKNKWGKIVYKTEECEIINETTGRREIKRFHKLGLTKVEDLFMYTDPDKAVEIPPLPEEEI